MSHAIIIRKRPAATGVRARFEAWYRRKFGYAPEWRDDDYADYYVIALWMGFRAGYLAKRRK